MTTYERVLREHSYLAFADLIMTMLLEDGRPIFVVAAFQGAHRGHNLKSFLYIDKAALGSFHNRDNHNKIILRSELSYFLPT